MRARLMPLMRCRTGDMIPLGTLFLDRYLVECPRLWRITMIYYHIEGICKWVNSEQIIPTASNYLWSSVVGVVKVDYFDFPCEIFEILCELDVWVLGFWNFSFISIFSFTSNFFLSNLFIFELCFFHLICATDL